MDFSSLLPQYVPVRLPSLGKFYTNMTSEFINIREGAAPEESLLDSANTDNSQQVVEQILANCIKEKIDPRELTVGDSLYLLLWLRINTYRQALNSDITCVNCNSTSTYELDPELFKINYQASDVTEPVELLLPRSKIVVLTRCTRNWMSARADARVNEVRLKGIKGNPTEALIRAYSTTRITLPTGESSDNRLEIEDLFLTYLPSDDSLYFDTKRQECFNHGVETSTTMKCQQCGRDMPVSLPLGRSLFRPPRYAEPASNGALRAKSLIE